MFFLIFSFKGYSATAQTCISTYITITEDTNDPCVWQLSLTQSGEDLLDNCENSAFRISSGGCPSFSANPLTTLNSSVTLIVPPSVGGYYVLNLEFIGCGTAYYLCVADEYFSGCQLAACDVLSFDFTSNQCFGNFQSVFDDPCDLDIGEWTWDFGDGSPIISGFGNIPANQNGNSGTFANPTHEYPADDTFTVTQTVTLVDVFTGNQFTISCSEDIVIDDCPQDCPNPCEFTAEPRVSCNRLFIDLQACSGAGNIYTWDAGNGNITTGTAITAEYWDINTYWNPNAPVSLTVTEPNGTVTECPSVDVLLM